jgi:hypothetical protein
MSDVSCVIFYAGKMLQTIEFPQVALNINLFEGPLGTPPLVFPNDCPTLHERRCSKMKL